MSRKTTKRSSLKTQVTLWNHAYDDVISGGVPEFRYHKKFIEFAASDNIKFKHNSSAYGDYYLEIYDNVSVVTNENGEICAYCEPYIYANVTDEERKNLWTLNKDFDYIGFGIKSESEPQIGTHVTDRDYIVNVVMAKYDKTGKLHHWEVYLK